MNELCTRIAHGTSTVKDAERVRRMMQTGMTYARALAEIAAGDEPKAAARALEALEERRHGRVI